MGGIYSGRQASHEPCIEDFYSLDVCLLYRRGFLEPNVEDVLWLPNGYGIEIVCKENYWGWERCIIVEYLSRQADGKIKRNEQVIGIEFVDVLNGKARRPYFYCPKLEERVSVLILGDSGFAHRTYYGYLYRIQRLGHFDRAVMSGRKIKNKLGCSDSDAASDPPFRPKGMHRKTFRKYQRKHAKAVWPIIAKIGHML